MDSYGELIREIRLSKGLTQKEVYTGIISRSYAIGFEKGKHEITLSLFEEILKRIMVSLDEFFFIYREFSSTEDDSFWIDFAELSGVNDVVGMQALLDKITLERTEQTEVRKAILHTRIQTINHYLCTNVFDESNISDEYKKIIHDYLWKMQTWTLEEVRIFANGISFFEEEVQIRFYQIMLKAYEKYRYYDRGRLMYCHLFAGMIDELIIQNKLEAAKQVWEILKEASETNSSYNTAFYRIVCNYYQGLIWMKEGEVEKGYRQAKRALQTWRELHYETIADLYFLLLKEFLEKENIQVED
ncbi:Rgg/GadR/MutR family transcriptional regulator [Listeria monocytogenes]|nr:Rgg/GadR/MutR family transcriptional regulator [Listeria monocytogenes]EDP7491259.1 helix-turn-helix domain-containing protein [Listeria monocytogenes]EEN9597274.1 helix-turn-helix domain-containing protein [Listeria monocytogenes]EEO0593621.1 helix-turn-helix domain-containing protein [Listeria monocytogenes]EEO1136416.1 helix-turn-helix domain-containing protein [Listeria monocytogenes]